LKYYETLFILSPILKPDQVETLTKEIRNALEAEKVENLSEEPPEKRPLAYPIKKSTEGLFVIYRFHAAPGALDRIKVALKHKDAILRSLFTVKGDSPAAVNQPAGQTPEP
jgi:ribosomal protein S6